MMTNQEILVNGPEGWTHYVLHNGTNYYFKIASLATSIWTDKWEAYSENRLSLPDLDNVRNRSDIERIVYLESVLKGEVA